MLKPPSVPVELRNENRKKRSSLLGFVFSFFLSTLQCRGGEGGSSAQEPPSERGRVNRAWNCLARFHGHHTSQRPPCQPSSRCQSLIPDDALTRNHFAHKELCSLQSCVLLSSDTFEKSDLTAPQEILYKNKFMRDSLFTPPHRPRNQDVRPETRLKVDATA
ncbi:uncharacterized protein LOC113927318 [Zalophus californianus]|uniref:Uncharacterized protein LOC113927318 n=1 Tax=Zalophus californianus TaxID=9704 RepID=A0A6J2DSY8_ZALCA|nr:uncharacterized protein LOC113927318 [Zalophus californianus]